MKNLATMHLNTSVYEQMESADKKEMLPLFKQINNPLLVKGVIIERRIDETWNEIEQEMCNHFEVTPDRIKAYGVYPMSQLSKDQKLNFTLAYGWCITYTQPDPTAPIAVPVDDPAAREEALRKALTPRAETRPFFMLIPETDAYMFSISLDHVPASAVTEFREVSTDPTEEGIVPPMGVDMAQPYVNPEELEIFNMVAGAISNTGTAESLIGEGQPFKTQEELDAFMNKYAILFHNVVFHPTEEK